MNSVRYGSQCVRSMGNNLFAVTTKGEVCTFNANLNSNIDSSAGNVTSVGMQENQFKQEIPVIGSDGGQIQSTPFTHPLENGFGPGSAIFVTAKINENADREQSNQSFPDRSTIDRNTTTRKLDMQGKHRQEQSKQ